MIRSMYTATNTMTQLQSKLDMISSNIANSNTTGYKSRNASFGEMLNQQINNNETDTAERQTPRGIRLGIGVQMAQTKLNTAVGAMSQTNRNLDFALQNENQYFAVKSKDSDELLLSRQGNFYLSPNDDGSSDLVNSDGYSVVDGDNNPIQFKQDISDVTVTGDGVLKITYVDGTTDTSDLAIVEVNQPDLLEQDKDKYLRYSDELAVQYPGNNDIARLLSGDDRAGISIQGGMLEGSNVDLSKEMSELINTQRSYQFNARTVTMADQMSGLINSVR